MPFELPRADINELADRWAEARGLRRDKTYFGQSTLGGLLAKRGDRWHGPSVVEKKLLDHSRYFKAPGKHLPGVAVSAPYIANLKRSFVTLAAAQLEMFGLAGELGLEIRVGLPHDIIWPGSINSPMGTYPIVWWSHERCDLPALEAAAEKSNPASLFGTSWNKPLFYLPDHPLVKEDFTEEDLQKWACRFGRAE